MVPDPPGPPNVNIDPESKLTFSTMSQEKIKKRMVMLFLLHSEVVTLSKTLGNPTYKSFRRPDFD